jgi:kynureninase
MANASQSEIEMAKAYFDRFVAAFATFDGSEVAELFAPPVVAVRSDGSSVGLATQDDVIRYYQSALDEYRGKGCTSARWFDLAVTPMGRASMLGAVTWQLLKADATVITEWRQSYGLRRIGDGEPKAFACASHSN